MTGKTVENTHARQKKESFLLFCARLIVSLTGKTVENTHARQKKESFLLFCARLIVSLQV
jgi:hypothetical protein